MEKIRVMLSEIVAHLEQREVMQTWEVIDMIMGVQKEVNDYDSKTRMENRNHVTELKEKYFLLTWKKPFNWWWESVLEIKVAELLDANLVQWPWLRNKKSEWMK